MKKIITAIVSLIFAAQPVAAPGYSVTNDKGFLSSNVREAYYDEFGVSESEIENSPVKPKLTVSKLVVPDSEKTNIQRVEISVEGADYKYSDTQLHIFYDKRLLIKKNAALGLPVVEGNQKDLSFGLPIDASANFEEYGMSCVVLYTTAKMGDSYDKGIDGVLWTIDFELPVDAQPGDVYPIDIEYYSTAHNNDKFNNLNRDYDSKLMNAYVFTKGIYNRYNPYEGDEYLPSGSAYDGYIAVKEIPATTSVTSALTTSTTTDTTTETASESTTTTTTTTAVSTSTTVTAKSTAVPTTRIPAVTTTVTGIYDTTLQYIQYDDHVEISGCKPNLSGNVVFPESINNLPVTKIRNFGGNAPGVTSVFIPDSVTEIGRSAFSSCYNLSNITIPQSVTKIGENAFLYCSKLKYMKVLNPDCKFQDGWGIPNNTVIYGYVGSTAETYASTYGYSFEDINSFSEALYTTTARTTKRTALKTSIRNSTTTTAVPTTPVPDPGSQRLFGDIDGNNLVDACDASIILTYYSYMSVGGKGTLEEFLQK